MVALNKATNMPELSKIMREFARESEMMESKQEMIGDVLDDTLDDEEDEKESEMIVNQVLDELGVSLSEGLVDVPGKKQQVVEPESKQVDEKDQALEARFNNLRGQ